VTQEVAPDPDVAAIVSQFKTLAAPLANKVVGHITADLTTMQNAAGESILGDVIADAQLAYTAGGTSNAQIAFMNPGGIRSDILYAPSGTEMPGEVTYQKAFTAQPFSNTLVTISLTGAQIKRTSSSSSSTWTARRRSSRSRRASRTSTTPRSPSAAASIPRR
jgi:5'-nucleotidase